MTDYSTKSSQFSRRRFDAFDQTTSLGRENLRLRRSELESDGSFGGQQIQGQSAEDYLDDYFAALNASIVMDKPTGYEESEPPGGGAWMRGRRTAPSATDRRLDDKDLEAIARRVGAGVVTPFNNMGVTEDKGELDDGTEEVQLFATGRKGTFVRILVPRAMDKVDRRAAFVDQVTFTIPLEGILSRYPKAPYNRLKDQWSSADRVLLVSDILQEVFGFGVMGEVRPKNGYDRAFDLGNGCGFVALGCHHNVAQAKSVCVHIFGHGTMNAESGWNDRLKTLIDVMGGKITRVDVAADFFNGQYTSMQAFADWEAGRMQVNNNRPFAEFRGDLRRSEDRTFYVGKRTSGKQLCVYQKFQELLGRLGLKSVDEDHPLYQYRNWWRVECRWGCEGRLIPLDILTNCGQYLAGAYPALSWVNEVQERVKTIKKVVQTTAERAVSTIKHQYGAGIRFLREMNRQKAKDENAANYRELGDMITLDMITRVGVSTLEKIWGGGVPVGFDGYRSLRLETAVPF
jgi:phage replication initiation protein